MIKYTSMYIDLKTYLFQAFSFLKIAWAVSELLGLSPAMRGRERSTTHNNKPGDLFISKDHFSHRGEMTG